MGIYPFYDTVIPEFKVTTAPAIEPVTTAEVKLFGRIDGTYEDTLISGFITAVRDATEQYLGRSLITQSLTLTMDQWLGDVVTLPRPPLIAITVVRTVDESGTATVYDSDNYYVRTIPEPGQLVIKQGSTVPSNSDRDYGGFEIEYTAGYGASATDVPQIIRDAIKLWAVIVYENRVLDPTKMPPQVLPMLAPYRMPRI